MSAVDENQQVSATLAVGALHRPVLARLLGALAARADLPVDRLNDTLLVGDALAAAAPAVAADGVVNLTATVGQRSLELSVGPFASGGASRLRSAAEIPQAGDVIGRLADEVEVTDAEGGEYLVLHVRG